MAELKLPFQPIHHHLIGERDYAKERSAKRPFLLWPLNVAFGLNSFELFQGLNNFLIRVVDGVVSFVPGSRNSLNSSSYIETSMPLTRFRNYHDKTPEDKETKRIHAMILFDDRLLVHWLNHKNKKTNKGEPKNSIITGFQLFKGSSFMSFKSSESQNLIRLKELLKLKLRSTNFHEEFEIIKMIGRGGFSCVYLARNIISGKQFAVKAFNKRQIYLKAKGKECIENEITCMRRIPNHRNILKLFEVFETQKYVYLVLEMISGDDLQDRMNQQKQYSEKEVKNIMKGIFEGLKYIHDCKVMHRDLKPSNILLRSEEDQEEDVCIADFGLSTPEDVESYLLFRCGTPGFTAPEILNNEDPNKKHSNVCDVFSSGAIFYYLLTRKPLFKSNEESILYNNCECDINFYSKHLKYVSPNAMDLLRKTLQKNPEKRISCNEALNHPFFAGINKVDSANFLGIPDERDLAAYHPTCHSAFSNLNASFCKEKNNISRDTFSVLSPNNLSFFGGSPINLECFNNHCSALNGYIENVEFSENGESSFVKKKKKNNQVEGNRKGILSEKSCFSKSLPKLKKKKEGILENLSKE